MNPIRRRRSETRFAHYLPFLAKEDGATVAYQFNESSGNLINLMGSSTFDLSVDAVIAREIESPVGPDYFGYHIPGTAGTSPTNGQIVGNRPIQSGISAVTFEAVVKYGTPTNNTMILEGDWVGVRQQFGIETLNPAASLGNMGFLAATGGNITAFDDGGDLGRWHHLVWLNAGDQSLTFVDGHFRKAGNFTLATNDAPSQSGAKVAIGGDGTNPQDVYWGWFAVYLDVALTINQIKKHAIASGCPDV